MIIAANLHDIGKLAIPNSILDKNGKLTEDEYAVIKSHTYYTRVALEKLMVLKRLQTGLQITMKNLMENKYPYGLSSEKFLLSVD